jgi:hypothetical protein
MPKIKKRVSSAKVKLNIRRMSVNFLDIMKKSKDWRNLKRKSGNNTKLKEKKLQLKLIRKSGKEIQLEL